MSNENSGGGFLGALIAGAGIVGVLALPVVIARRFGINVLGFLNALGVTLLAVYSSELVALARECTPPVCIAFATVVEKMDGVGWWLFATLSWAVWLTRVLFVPAPVEGEHK